MLLKVFIFLTWVQGREWNYLTLFEGVVGFFLFCFLISLLVISGGASDPFILLQSLRNFKKKSKGAKT